MALVMLHGGSLLVDPTELARCWSLLSDDERARAARFLYEIPRRRFIVRRARLHELLVSSGGKRRDLIFGSYGKPRLPFGPAFSASHSAERWLVALSSVEVGVDIEAVSPAIEWRTIAQMLFAPAEVAEIHDLRAFFDCWVRKEAFVKAIGKGLSFPLKNFDVSVGRVAALRHGGAGWSIAELPLSEGFAGAVVAANDGTPLHVQLISEGFRTV